MPLSKSPADNPVIRSVPQYMGSRIRKAFFLEAVANLFTISLLTNTRFTLSLLLNNPAHVNPASILFSRLFGGIIVGCLTSALLAGSTNTRYGVESRRQIYLLLGLGEAVLIPILVLETVKDGDQNAALGVKIASASIACLVPPLPWKLYTLCIRPDLFGRYKEIGGQDGQDPLLEDGRNKYE